MTHIVIKASQVAAIIGKHRYKPRNEVFDEIWQKYASSTFTGKTKKDKAEEILSLSDNAQGALEFALSINAKDSSEVQKIFTQAKKAINSDSKLSSTQKAEVLEHVRSKVYTTHGTRSEDKTSDKVSVDEKVTLVRDEQFYSLPICTLDSNHFVLVGKIDRIEENPDGSRTLVEIKNRTNRLFRQVVVYEYIQVQVYLQMLGLVNARLVEQYNNQVLSHPITRDEDMWTNEIMPGIEAFCKELNESMNS
jgi:PD-(D/E)XK nuclease superfamily